MRRKLFVGNWKMNGSLVANGSLLRGIKAGAMEAQGDLAVCVPACYLAQCAEILIQSGIALGAQDVSSHTIGAYTGEVSARMLQDFGCRYVIVGHSERREYHGETDEEIAHKAQRAMAAGLTPIVCVGETLAEREAGHTRDVIEMQMGAFLSVLEPEEANDLIIAYEPIWAVGTGRTATPEMAQEVHAMLRKILVKKSEEAGDRVRILYGGSMRPSNARELLSMPDIDGGLIGGAALKAADFLAIAKAVL
ncbi:MAG: triose-phosphate isomerase [Alistipes senegalensis]|nr:triose-phosphate isomerase [Oxalobacter formigenes]MCM1280859.1 triose-phosphate isomerase [Alistipes senegalensis]